MAIRTLSLYAGRETCPESRVFARYSMTRAPSRSEARKNGLVAASRSTKETCASAKVANARPQAARRTLIFSSACEHVNTWRRWARAARGKM